MSREKHNWGKLVYQFAESGLPASVWCEQNGIAPSTFYLHLKEQRELASVSDPESMPKHPESHEIVKLDFDEDNAINDYSNVSPDSSSIPRIAPRYRYWRHYVRRHFKGFIYLCCNRLY